MFRGISHNRYIVVSIASGVLFAILDGLINANPLAETLNKLYAPIARSSVNIPAGILIDLAYGFVMAGLFLILYRSLPGKTGFVKGLGFAVMAWFFRVVMAAASSWMMFDVPAVLLVYSLTTGFVEMLAIGVTYGLLLKPDDKW